MKPVDLLIVGSGPAGMAAAVTARRTGLDVLVVDEQPAPGGQIWRDIETVAGTERGTLLGAAYLDGRRAAEAFRASGAAYEPGAQLWQIEPGFRGFVTKAGEARIIEARTILLATGAQERPAPFPGWTLPGILTVGAGQILLKNAGQVPAKPVWLAGSGPLMLLYMTQLLKAGGEIAGYLDTTPPGRLSSALRYLPGALRAVGDLFKGIAWSLTLRASGVRRIRHVTDIEAVGTEHLEAIRFRTASGTEETVQADALLVHEGVIPSVHVALALGSAVTWRDDQDCYVPILDAWGESSQPNVFIAGDGAGIAGAKAAALRGEIAALGIATKLGQITPEAAAEASKPARAKLERELALRPFLDALFRPREAIFIPDDETVVCRCEEITAREIRAMARLGRPGPNQVKAFTRAGMGPCQGRQCGYTVTRILAAAEGRSVEEVGFYRIRPPLKPVTLGELASLREPEATS
ncbi:MULTISPECIES: FAD-dependent oxidoreductase [unclassified Mesorhizobium]|uniref:FAD-dependent oxidoreductase n=1 Tax=unclassified Mesorhizobium TaxID=325217 RepID=UPI00112E68E2|nr:MULTISPECIES: FAD-dependent oxidoreductase [unclassified Mesorhizobium]TPK95327.1 FAD-dependent oxidoreductase [Mesorhizobium sp. B2-4-16]TPL61021.1 FAD-dependent oxidoreductase [Mesorhizobium sp. B2-4-3]